MIFKQCRYIAGFSEQKVQQSGQLTVGTSVEHRGKNPSWIEVGANLRKILLLIMVCFLSVVPMMIMTVCTAKAENAAMQIQHVSRLKLYFTIDGRDIAAYYTGAIVDNRPYGEGIYEIDDTNGPWGFIGTLENGVFSNGTMTDYPYTMSFSDDESYATYSGPFINGQPGGDGVYTLVTNGNVATLEGHYDPELGFSGNTTNYVMSYMYNNITFTGVYTGAFLNGEPDGEGAFLSEGEIFFQYNGIWDDGTITGPGELHTNNVQMNYNGIMTRAEYKGQISNGKFDGKGRISIINEEGGSYTYDGSWLNNVFSGNGTLTVSKPGEAGYKYSGSWKDGLYDGDGSLIYDNINIVKYIGNFVKGQFRPTLVQMITCLCSSESSKNKVPDISIQYIEKHGGDFINHSIKNINIIDDFSYESYSHYQTEENTSSFKARIKVMQMKKYITDLFGYPVTEFIGYDMNSNIYYGYYIGYLDTLYSGEFAEIIAYPIGYSSFKSQNGNDVPSLRFLAYGVNKVNDFH